MGILFGQRERRSPRWGFEPPIPPFPGADATGRVSVSSSPDGALAVPTVWACVGLLSNAVSMLPLETFRRNGEGVPARQSDPSLLVEPSAGMTQSEWLHMLMVSLLLRGNAYGRISQRDGMLRPTQVDLLDPDSVAVSVDRDTGNLIYKLSGEDVTRDMWHVRGMTLPGMRVGLSPVSYAAATLGIDLAARKFGGDFLDGGGVPKAVLETSEEVNQEQAQTVKDRLLAATRNREPVVLGVGLKYNKIQVSPEESQFLATIQANVAQVAKFFWVPAEMVGGSSGNSMTYSNVEQRSLDFLTYGVSFWLKRIEDAVYPLLPKPQYVRFNTAALLRTDAETQAKVDVTLIAGKIKVPSEVRQERDLPPMTDDQKTEADMVPLTATPLGGVKALPALKEPPGPVAPVPLDDQQTNSAPGVTHNWINVQPAEVRLEQPITVHPAAADVHVDVQPAEVRMEQPITVQPAAAPDVRVVTVADTPATRSRRVERDTQGDIVRIVEE